MYSSLSRNHDGQTADVVPATCVICSTIAQSAEPGTQPTNRSPCPGFQPSCTDVDIAVGLVQPVELKTFATAQKLKN
jgi:hypothetical protein